METQPTPARTLLSRASARLSIIALTVLALSISFVTPTRAATSDISGTAFHDADRDGVFDSGEAPMPGHRLYLFRAGAYIAQSTTDAVGRYGFTALEDGRYEVAYDASSWAPLKMELVPTTTGSVFPRRTVDVSGSLVTDFGW